MDLRIRVLRDSDAGMPSDEVAEKYFVSRAWVDRLKQRRRETGEVAPRKQTRWRTPILHAQLPQLEAVTLARPCFLEGWRHDRAGHRARRLNSLGRWLNSPLR
jgi:transposase